jgi:Icc protein
MRHRFLAGLALSAGLASSCLAPGSERASHDKGVGRAAAGSARITVDDGLSTVRRIEDGALDIWAGAPVITARVSLDAGAADAWTVTVDNCLPDAILSVTTEAGKPLEAARSPGDFPTQCRARISRGEERSLVLTLRPPDADDLTPFRFALMSDIQEAIDRVQDIYARMNQDPSIRFLLSAGDLTDRGEGPEFERLQRELRSLGVPCYATPGNHDIAAGDGIYQQHFGRGSYRFVYRGVQFTLLDSASASIAPDVYEQLSGWLEEGRDRVHVVAMHIPPLDPVGERNAAFGSRAEAGALLSRLAEGKVDLTLYGHNHAFYTFENAGIPAFISGGGGAHPELLTGIGRHYLTVDIGAGGVVSTAVVRID